VPFFLPRSRTGEGGRGRPRSGGGRRHPGAGGGRGQGEKEEGARACYSRAHLGQGWLEEVPPRQGAAGGGGWWRRRKLWCGSAIGRYWKLAAGVRSGEEGCRPFIGRVGRFGGGDLFGGEVAGWQRWGRPGPVAGRRDGSGRGGGRRAADGSHGAGGWDGSAWARR
jgi:hypothetical protein